MTAEQELSLEELYSWVEAFASCAIEGNNLAIEMIDLWNKEKGDEFVRRLLEDWIEVK